MRTFVNWIFGLLLFGVLKWAFNSFAWDALVQALQSRFGIKEADVIAAASSFLIPGIIAFLSIAGAYNIGKRSAVVAAPPNRAQPPEHAQSLSRGSSLSFLLQSGVILAIVSGGIGYSIAFLGVGSTYNLTEKNANIDVTNIEPHPPTTDTELYRLHIFFQNKGPITATDIQHTNTAALSSDKPVPDFMIDAQFVEIRKQLKMAIAKSGGATLEAGEQAYYTYILPINNRQYQAILAGATQQFVFFVAAYRDKLVPIDKVIFTEKCWLLLQTGAFSRCEHHNQRVVE